MNSEALTTTDLMGFMLLLLIGGLETTVHLLNISSALRFQERPSLMERLRAESALHPHFVDEVLRHS